MFAIASISGKQVKIEKGMEIFVDRLEAEEGAKIDIDQIQLIDADGKVKIGKPLVKGARAKATVLEHVRGDKVIVFKKKRRKGYRVKNGHRQLFTKIKVDSIKA